MKKNDIEQWKCKLCSEESHEKSSKDIADLQSKIHNLSIEENLDHETSLTLAAELGSALLNENCLLKQQLHDLKETKSENLLELEDRLKGAEEMLTELQGNNQMLKEEMCFMASKLEEERTFKEDFLLQGETEKNEFTTKINNLSSEKSVLNTRIQQLTEDLTSRTINFEKETGRLQMEITALRDTEVVLRTELESRNALIHSIQTNCQELVLKLDEQDNTMRAYLKSLVVNTKSHLNIKPSSSSTTLYKENNTPRHSNISLHDELLNTSKDLMTSGDRQTCNEKLETTMTISPTEPGNSATSGIKQTCNKKLETNMTTSPTAQGNSQTSGIRQTCNKKLETTMTTSPTETSSSLTSGVRQICDKKLNLKNNSIQPNNTFYSVSLQMTKAVKQSDNTEQIHKALSNKKPPLHAKIRPKEESFEEFFSKHIDFYNKYMMNRYNYMKDKSDLLHTKNMTATKNSTHQSYKQQTHVPPQPQDLSPPPQVQIEDKFNLPSTSSNFLEISQPQNAPV